jgi:UDP-GlcNAc:undecaprenyl-phosphate/decaprenyl-phosphate GlcNAc-1-phosphate transferase
LALPILDVSLAILRRGMKGLPFFRPDRKHIHHRLVASGFSHRRTVLTLYGLSLLFSFMAFAVFWSQGRLVPILFGFMFLTLIVSARSLGFMRDWFAVGEYVGVTLQVRKETRYALSMSRWLELEAERVETLQELWDGLVFMAYKLGFSEVRLVLQDSELLWSKDATVSAAALQRQRHDLIVGNVTALEIAAHEAAMPDKVFEQLGELTAEAWMKAATRWQSVRGKPVELDKGMAANVTRYWQQPKSGFSSAQQTSV